MTKSLDQFLDALRRSGLFSTAEFDRITQELVHSKPTGPADAAARLVEQKVLTAYQAENLLGGDDACVIAGRYRPLDKIGEGGMGAVYRAGDAQLDREVAIKVLPDRSLADPDAVARFRREARALAKVSHPNIVHAHDAGEDGGRHFLVMEHVEGVNLARLLQERGRIAPGLAAEYVRQAALGLQHAHDRGLVHRDLKPGNLLLSRDGVVKILDLGLARFLQDQVSDPGLTREGSGMGTPDYMAPEQFRDAHNADPRADIYSLGCTLYHLLAGRVPFPGTSLSEKARARAEEAPPDFATACPEAPAGLALAVLKMMAKRPAARFQSAAEVAEALTPFVASSSGVLPDLRTTATWQRGQLTLSALPRRKRWIRGALMAAAVAGLMVAAAFVGDRLLGPSEPEQPGGATQAAGPKAPPGPEEQKPKKIDDGGKKVEPPAPKVVTIPNGLTVAQDGTGQFRTINEALEKVKPGQTIRVLDSATYRETLQLNQRDQFAGVTLEAPERATLEFPPQERLPVQIRNVPRFTLRGFRIVARPQKGSLITVLGGCEGLTLEHLDLAAGSDESVNTIQIAAITSSPTDLPVRVQYCSMRGGGNGIILAGQYPGADLLPIQRIILRENVIRDAVHGVNLVGAMSQIQVVGNRFSGITVAAIRLWHIGPRARTILIANNTTIDCACSLRVMANKSEGEGIEIRNNLVLGASQPDMVFVRYDYKTDRILGPGDTKALLGMWQVSHNWRETKHFSGAILATSGWIPPSTDDKIVERIDGVGRDRAAKDFLRPAKDSPLATKGAGGDLPPWVGAVPPEGAAPWDWERTWKARFEKPAGQGKGGK